ncbi:hypothetical protein U6B65_01430 [Oscillospiraceae bacterium MB08-C2-2]|nr:hypothetical protein U6B65_01430 [Oscillospiraceae bacterium MB08-C2-2]
MTARERTAIVKAFQHGITKARQSIQYWKSYETACAAGDSINAEIKQRQSDTDRGEAYGVAQTLALIGGSSEMVKAIYKELGE